MKLQFFKVLKVFTLLILPISFISCSQPNLVVKDFAIINHKDLSGANSFGSLVESLVKKQEKKILTTLKDEVVLISDFVNIEKLNNKSKLGFLLAENLKNSISNRGIIIKQVELSRYFQYGKSGFNMLTRKHSEIIQNELDSQYALIGSYTFTKESLIVFMRLVDIQNGTILSSATGSTLMDGEIREMEKESRRPHVITPMVL